MALTQIKLLDREPFKRQVITVGNLPTSFVDSMSYYEQLAWICQYITNTLIPQINLNSAGINEIQQNFVELREEVQEAIKEIPQLRADFETLVKRFDQALDDLEAQYNQFKEDIRGEIDAKISNVRMSIMEVVNAYYKTLDDKIGYEVTRLDDKIENFAIANTIVFNTLQGRPTSIQDYLDDLAGLNRTDAITAGEYDNLELTAQVYDDKQITAHDYDYFGKTILMA